ncbi:MAG TPA: helix-turn-helix transcriptional regulator [Tepidisphaeraceae bacterium]|nr:helix-turn-helix transcriptional regulator [Tepidisphaeraceae bacterium]
MTPTDLMSNEQSKAETAFNREPLAARWVDRMSDAEQAAHSQDRHTVWIVRRAQLADRLVCELEWPTKRSGYVVIMGSPRPELLPALMRRFERVAYSTDFLPRQELEDVLQSSDRRERFVGGIVDRSTKTITLWRGDLTPFVVPFSAFTPTANDIRPNFGKFSVSDYGHTLRFGPYEAATDAVLYEYDPEFRRRLNEKRRLEEQTLGASIRRLRKQRQLTRNDFHGVDPKTLSRIERNEVHKPQEATLRIIAKRLGVSVEDLTSY